MDDMNLGDLTSEQLDALQRDVATEANRRLRIASIPNQIRDTVTDARLGGEIPDATIREIFEDAMNADID